MAEVDPLVAYVHRIQTFEHNIQRALEGVFVASPDEGADNLTLDEALMGLIQAYGVHNNEAISRGQLVANFRTMIEAYQSQTFSTLEKRNQLIKRASTILQESPEDMEVEKARQALAAAEAARDAAKLAKSPT